MTAKVSKSVRFFTMLALNNGYSGWQIRLWFLDSAAQVEANHKKWVKNNGGIQNDTHNFFTQNPEIPNAEQRLHCMPKRV